MKLIKEYFRRYHVQKHEHSDCLNYPSIEFSILLHENQMILDDVVDLLVYLDEKKCELVLYFSLLGDYCYYYVIETLGHNDIFEWKFTLLPIEQLKKQEKELIVNFDLMLESTGYTLIDADIAHEIVPNIETEFQCRVEATFFNCLFTDMV